MADRPDPLGDKWTNENEDDKANRRNEKPNDVHEKNITPTNLDNRPWKIVL